MPRRLAATLALLVFSICLIVGIDAGNSMATVLGRSLVAMGGTLLIALLVGAMAQRMLDENVSQKELALKQSEESAGGSPGGVGSGTDRKPGR